MSSRGHVKGGTVLIIAYKNHEPISRIPPRSDLPLHGATTQRKSENKKDSHLPVPIGSTIDHSGAITVRSPAHPEMGIQCGLAVFLTFVVA